MEDVFYFTKSKISIVDILKLAEEAGYGVDHDLPPLPDDPCKQYDTIDYYVNPDTGKTHFWAVEAMSAECDDFDGWDEDSLRKVSNYGHASAFSFSYNPGLVHMLPAFLKLVLQKYGGWVACDDATFTQYTVENIEEMTCYTESYLKLGQLNG